MKTVYTGSSKTLGSPNRLECICDLVHSGSRGEFAIVHKDNCRLSRTNGAAMCDCVPDVWKIERASS